MDINEKLPENLEWYENQIAGHHPSVIRNGVRQIGIIKERGSKIILKLVQEGIRGEREIAFYEDLKCYLLHNGLAYENNIPNINDELRKFLPKYYGTRIIKIGQKEIEFLQLEDIITPFKSPCIMDIKMGRVTYDPLASDDKKRVESAKCVCQPVFGFRVLGYRINSDKCDEPLSRDRVWGKSLIEENIKQAFEEYLLRGRPHESIQIIEQLICRIKQIKEWFERQKCFHFYASSLLLVYEGDNSEAENELRVDVRMIDFSHVFEAQSELDLNYLHGLNYLLNAFNEILEKITCEPKNNMCK